MSCADADGCGDDSGACANGRDDDISDNDRIGHEAVTVVALVAEVAIVLVAVAFLLEAETVMDEQVLLRTRTFLQQLVNRIVFMTLIIH